MKQHPFAGIRWLYLALGTAAMLCMGTIYSWSVLKVPLAESFGWQPTQLSLAYSLSFCVFSAGSILGSALSKKAGHRVTLALGGVLMFVGYGLMSRLQGGSVAQLFVYFSGLVGGGFGIAYPVLLAWVGSWFTDRPGLSSGILMMGFGCSALIVGRPATKLFDVPGVGWRGCYLLLGTLAGTSLLLCAVLFRGRAPSPAAGSRGASTREYPPAQVLRQASFWVLVIYLLFNGCMGSSMSALLYDYCLSVKITAGTAATLVGVMSAFNGLSRILFGAVYDRFGRKITMLAGSLTVLGSGLCLLAALLLQMQPLAVLGIALTGLGYGYGPVLAPVVIRSFFGNENFSINFSLCNMRSLVNTFFMSGITAIMVASGSFTAPLLVMVGCACVAFAFQFALKEPAPTAAAPVPAASVQE